MKEEDLYTVDSDSLLRWVRSLSPDVELIAPVKKEGGIVFARAGDADEIAVSWRAAEAPGVFSMSEGDGFSLDQARTMNSAKDFTHVSRQSLLAMSLTNEGWEAAKEQLASKEKVFLGLKPCDVWGMQILDKALINGYAGKEGRQEGEPPAADSCYSRQRQGNRVIALNCTSPGGNCFCSSFGYGPFLQGAPFDLLLTDLGGCLLAEAGSLEGHEMLAQMGAAKAEETHLKQAAFFRKRAQESVSRTLDTEETRARLNEGHQHHIWKEVSEKCLSCGNCVWVCPTCYCFRVHDKISLDGKDSSRERQWDACHHLEFAQVAGHNFREKREDRVRQWVNHKLNWTVEQYGVAGCVGCGRCITWCPTGIDILEVASRVGE